MKVLKNSWPYLLAPTLSLIIFALFFQIWKIDLALPAFSYSNDGLFYIFITKNMVDTGWFSQNANIGLPHFSEIFNLYDFPLQAEMLQILIIKFLTYFSSNPFLIANCFFILTFPLIAATAFIVLRSFKISIFTATIISILYAFLPYHFARNVWHLFLSNYMVVPLAVMVGMWIASDKISVVSLNKKKQYCLSPNKYFLISGAICALIAVSGLYYAYYSMIIFIFAWILCGLKKENFFDKNSFAVPALCGIIFAVISYLYLPTLLYQMQHGVNSSVANRGALHSEGFGLRIINLLLPVANHYIDYFANLTSYFEIMVSDEQERGSENLGILASSGFFFLILWLMAKNFDQENSFLKKTIKKLSLKKDEQNLISNLAALNILIVLFATAGGLVMLISITFPLIRSHARVCVFIAFISFFLVAIILDKIIERKKLFAQIAVIVIAVLALFDQVGVVSSASVQSEMMKNKFANDRNFIEKIENSLPKQAMIFVLPSFPFPEKDGDDYGSLIAYIHSKNLRWSYPAMAGRESSKWQEKVVKQDFKEFIASIKQAGFRGVYLDRSQYLITHGSDKLTILERNLRSQAGGPIIVSQNARLVFFEI